MLQCRGTTVKGERCKIRGSEYCRYHDGKKKAVAKSGGPAAKTGAPRPVSSPPAQGHIYIYTLSNLLTTSLWLQTKNLPNVAARHRDEWRPYSKRSPYLLLKVGMTTQPVSRRLHQWQDKCGHDLLCVHPDSAGKVAYTAVGQLSARVGVSTPSPRATVANVIAKLARLSIKPSTNGHGSGHGNGNGNGHGNGVPSSYSDYGFRSANVAAAERAVHQRLRHLYGHGSVFCAGCKPDSKPDLKRASDTYSIHVEWFLVPKTDIAQVFREIDVLCR